MFSRLRTRARSLRTMLTLLVAIPLVLCVVLTGSAIASRVDDAQRADAVATKVRAATAFQQLQNDLNGELIPSLALKVLEVPQLRKAVGLGSQTAASLGLSPQVVAFLRASTDADLTRLAANGQAAEASAARKVIVQLRHLIDDNLPISDYYDRAVAAVLRMSTAATLAAADAGADTTPALAAAIRDSGLAGTASQAGAAELARVAAYKFPNLGLGTSVDVARSVWLDTFGRFETASDDVLDQAGPRLAAQWRRAMTSEPTATYERTLRRYAENPAAVMPLTTLITMYQSSLVRANTLATINRDTSRRVEAAASRFVSDSTSSAWTIGGLVGLALVLSLLIAALVRRAIARPLGVLAEQAESVSRGELIDVTPHGPREIRTVGAGLSAAVESLRRVEAQAHAVAVGDLSSKVVSEPLPGPLGAVMHDSVTAIIDAIRDRDSAQEDLAYQATHDSLTDLPNRNQALVSIPHALHRARRGGELTCLMFVDLDYFKAVNDNMGHAAGDVVLQACARRMKSVVRESDIVFRLGGDEFVVLLEDVSRDFPFVAFAEKLIREVSRPIAVGDTLARVGASVGVSLCQDASVDADRLLVEADAAAYSAKASGRGRVGFFDENLRAALTQRAVIERGLEDALVGDGLVLDFQPVVEIGEGRPVGFEALLRWRHPEHGLIQPADFIPVAEKSSLINRIGRWTLRAALAQLAEWDAGGSTRPGLTMAVNISGRHLLSTELVDDVRNALAATDVAADRLVVEVTETVIVDDPIALDNMQQLRDMGVGVAIDDFGTGYTSIGQLPKLPVDVLKIDRSFTTMDGPGHRELVRLIVEAAHALGLSVVAEGIEYEQQADAMRELSVDTGQGFYYARPDSPGNAEWLGGRAALPAAPDAQTPAGPVLAADTPSGAATPVTASATALGTSGSNTDGTM